jgi:type IV pilus assembly protein PilB
MRGDGCRACFDTGFKGRVGVYEVLWASRAMRQAVAANPDLDAVRTQHLAQGGTLLINEGLRLAEEGVTSLDEVMRVAFSD